MTLTEKLKTISKPPIKPLGSGFCETLQNFWDSFIFPRLPEKNIMLAWNKILMEYVQLPNAMFALRFYNTAASKDYWDTLRRCALTKTNNGYSFFYTDNFHAAYYCKMAVDGYISSTAEILNAYNNLEFPARFGSITENEKSLMALPNKYSPYINNAGYKIAHIHAVGKNYFFNGQDFSLSDIVQKYFPGGERTDWQFDKNFNAPVRFLETSPEAKKFLVAEFLRFVHPFNYFLVPNTRANKHGSSTVCGDIAEYPPLLEFVKNKFSELYGSAYQEFLDAIMIDTNSPCIEIAGNKKINLSYELNIIPSKEKDAPVKIRNTSNNTENFAKAINRIPRWAKHPEQINYKIIRAYLKASANKNWASLAEMQNICVNDFKIPVKSFRNNFSSMLTDAGNSHGKVFERNGDTVTIWENVRTVLEENFL